MRRFRMWSDILAVVENHEIETDDLEFKAEFWRDDFEAAKDVAAFMNALGGTLLVGVSEADERAVGFRGLRKRRATQRLQQILDRNLVPNGAANAVTILELQGHDSQGAEQQVLVVEIEPWAHGPVACRKDHVYRFPERRGSHTFELPWEETMARWEAASRSQFIRFSSWYGESAEVDVEFASIIHALADDGPVPVPIRKGRFSTLNKVENDHIELVMLRTNYVKQVVTDRRVTEVLRGGNLDSRTSALAAILGSKVLENAWESSSSEYLMRIPYSLIEAAWRDSLGAVQVVLKADLIFAYDRWMLNRR